jgi:hypothetical protein
MVPYPPDSFSLALYLNPSSYNSFYLHGLHRLAILITFTNFPLRSEKLPIQTIRRSLDRSRSGAQVQHGGQLNWSKW